MSSSVLILGVGSALPTTKRNPSSQLLQMGGEHILIDCGEGTQSQLRRNKVGIQKIHHIFISHLHGDHYLGLMGLISSMSLLGRNSPLHIYGPSQLESIINLHLNVASSKLNFPIHFVATQQKENQVLFESEKMEVYTIPLKHKIFCTGFLFKEKPKPRKLIGKKLDHYNVPVYKRAQLKMGKDYYDEKNDVWIENAKLTIDPDPPASYAYCSDTAYFESIVPIIKGVKLLYHEATFIDVDKKRAIATKHSTSRQAASIAKKAEVEKLVLGHYSSRYLDLAPFLNEACEIFEHTVLGEENKVYPI